MIPKDGKEDNPGKHTGEDKGKGKDKRNDDPSWCIEDIEWDENGCLYVKNEQLAAQIYQAIWVDKHFCISCDNPNYDPTNPSGGGGDYKINMMCPC